MKAITLKTRRSFIKTISGAAGACLMIPASSGILPVLGKQESKEPEISPVEDLMREHGILRRVLLIYEEVLRRLEGGRDTPPRVLADSAGIIRRFVENYHEKLEEEELFPRFEKAGKLADLVQVLRDQHQAGRRLTDVIRRSSTSAALAPEKARLDLAEALRRFILMYRPHAAREDTVLFPAFRSLVPSREYHELGEKFEEMEEKLFGEGAFEKTVEEVAALEKTLAIHELGAFTPKV
ncbi:MAG: hemerythrin domain-containing protein [Thermodesulfobacteriota bacterium]